MPCLAAVHHIMRVDKCLRIVRIGITITIVIQTRTIARAISAVAGAVSKRSQRKCGHQLDGGSRRAGSAGHIGSGGLSRPKPVSTRHSPALTVEPIPQRSAKPRICESIRQRATVLCCSRNQSVVFCQSSSVEAGGTDAVPLSLRVECPQANRVVTLRASWREH